MARQPVRMTLSFPVEIAEALEQERARIATELRTPLSFNKIAMRILSLGIDASRNR